MMDNKIRNRMAGGIWGLIVGDALGVPVEFEGRDKRVKDPVTGMRGHGTYDQPVGTWSDDSTMTLCTIEGMTGAFSYDAIMKRFLRWKNEAYMTPYDEVFDMGSSTCAAITRYERGASALGSGGTDEHSNGNGSLMRILPAAYYLYAKNGNDYSQKALSYEIVHSISALTHAHAISQMSCGIYCSVICHLLNGKEIEKAIQNGIEDAKRYYLTLPEMSGYLDLFDLVDADFLANAEEDEIASGGYVLSSLEAALWCVLHSTSLKECLLKAVNLGRDTDTIAAIAGGLAGTAYGKEAVPAEWRDVIAKKEMIELLCRNFYKSLDV